MTERFLLRVQKGALVPADDFTTRRLREKGYQLGDTLGATLAKPRNPRFHRLVHQFGALLAENLDAFSGMDAHRVLKRLQIEARIACDEIPIVVSGISVSYWLPRSLAFASMDDGEFHEVFSAMCRHVSATYWPDCEPEQIEKMAEMMGVAA